MTFGKWIHLTVQFCNNVLHLFMYIHVHLMMVSKPKHTV
jgi:hypothetical protein